MWGTDKIYTFQASIGILINQFPDNIKKILNKNFFQMTFTRPANHRQLTFEEIAKSAKITVNEVYS